MARRRKGRPVSGWLILDKPVGMTSTQAVAVVRRLFQAQKAGHAGTLDPLASGCLPIALGEATKAMPHVTGAGKTYRFTVNWGAETDTDDSDGKTVRTSELRPSEADIAGAMTDFLGEIEQVPPAYSALKIDGERAYDLARDGEEVVLEARPVTIEAFEIVGQDDADHTTFEVACSKGTYVRSLARDLGRALGCLGHVSALRRLSVGTFEEDQLMPLDVLRDAEADGGAEALDEYLQPVEAALGGLTGLSLQAGDAIKVQRGQAVLIRGAGVPVPGPAYVTGGGQLLAIGEIEAGSFHPRRVFHL